MAAPWKSYERKKTPRATASPSARDLEWAAGFIEGEGNFRREPSTEQITVGQCYQEPLFRLQSLFGGSVRPRREQRNANWNQAWLWVVCGSRARGVMMTLLPLMTQRRRNEIQLALGGAS